MSMKYLGPSFDLHTGGVDNMFPHHEDEIAQSEGATGLQFAKYWMHCAHLVVEGQKMSKSLGNFYTLRDVLNRGFSGREVRYALMAVHYRQALNFSFDALQSARGAIQRLDEFTDRLKDVTEHSIPGAERENVAAVPSMDWVDKGRINFCRALDDDLNISSALSVLFDIVHEGNKRIDSGYMTPSHAEHVLCTLDNFDRVLGILRGNENAPDSDVLKLAEERQRARKQKHWADADQLRKTIESHGWLIKDTTDGFKLKRKGTA